MGTGAGTCTSTDGASTGMRRLICADIFKGMPALRTALFWLFSSRDGPRDRFVPRWIVLRALGLIYGSAFVSLLFQIRGLIGPGGILPAARFLEAVAQFQGLK